MSERTEVEVVFPLERPPTKAEGKLLLQSAFAQARRLVAPGRVLGLTKVIRAKSAEGNFALKFRFAVTAPEALQRVNGVRV